MRVRQFGVGVGICLLTIIVAGSQPAMAQQSEAQVVIDLINQLRAEYGLYAYTVNDVLMAVAQGQSDYQASIGQISHIGPGGTRPRDRVAAAGYAAPGSFFVHENIYGGTQATAYDAVQWWRNSSIHFQGMTSNRYVEIGAGVAYDSAGLVYFTALFAVRVGDSPPSAPSVAPPSTVSTPAVVPVEVALPGPDGAVWHEVQAGQTLWAIAQAYGVDVALLEELNGLPAGNPLIYPGDLILIRPASTATPPAATATVWTPTPAVTPSRTARPTLIAAVASRTGVPAVELGNQAPDTQPSARPGGMSLRDIVTAGLVVLALIGGGMMAVGLAARRLR